jgi:hypothetical protein
LSLIAVQTAVEAQTSDQGGADTRRWEIEWYGGLSLASPPSGGTTTLPPPGAPLTTSSPIFPSRQVPSWFFGDGAMLLNDVNAAFGQPNRLSPLDAGFDSPEFDPGGRAAFGISVRRTMTPRVSIEFNVDAVSSAVRLPDGLIAAAESSRESFESAIAGLLSSGPFSDVALSATRATSEGSRRDLSATTALNIHFRPLGSLVPYVTAGAGVVAGTGSAPSVTLEGHYRFSILDAVPIDETDRLTIRVERDTTFVAVAGGGVRRQVSERWGLRLDGRVFVGSGGDRLRLDATPASASATPAGFIESFTHPSVQFSNHASTGRQSTLSAPPLRGFPVFETGGLGARVLVTVGLFARF